jgi:hypothetical protein
MRSSSCILPFALLLALPLPAWAEGNAVVVPLVPSGVDEKTSNNLTSLISSELDFSGAFDTVNDIAAPSSLNSSCLSSTKCLAGIASGSDADVVVAGSVATGGAGLKINLIVYDAAKNAIVRKKSFDVASDVSALAAAAPKMAKELVSQGGTAAAAAEEAGPSADSFADEEDFSFDTSSDVKGKTKFTPEAKKGKLVDAEDDEERAAAAARQREETEAKLKAEARAKAEAEAKAKAEAEAKARAKAEAEARAKAAAAAEARAEAEAKAKEAARARAEAEAAAKAAAAKKKAPPPEEEMSDEDLEAELAAFSFGGGGGKVATVAAAEPEPEPEEPEEEEDTRPKSFSERYASSSGSKPSESRTSTSSTKTTASRARVVEPDPEEEEEEEEAPRASASRSSSRKAAEDDEDLDEDSGSSRTASRSSSRSSSRDEDEEEEEDDRRASRKSSDERASASRRSADDDEEEEETARRTSRSKAEIDEPSRSVRDDDEQAKFGVVARGGYARYGSLDFVTYGAELDIPVASRVVLLLGVEGASTNRNYTDEERAVIAAGARIQPEQVQDWNAILPINFGVVYKVPTSAIQPYVGIDGLAVAYTSKPDFAFGARLRGGCDFMVSENFGFNLDVGLGVLSGEQFELIQAGLANTGFYPEVSGGTVLSF